MKPENSYASLKIENIVASGKIADSLDLDDITSRLDTCTLDRKKFPGAVYHIADPKIVALLFSSGKIVLTGIHNPQEFTYGCATLSENLRRIGATLIDAPKVAITNMVCSYDTGTPINLNKMMLTFNLENIEYEPEQFPGLVYRLEDPNIVLLVFSSGKIILTGGKNIEDVKRAIDRMMPKFIEIQ
ncbi:TATA-box-binding protein [Methanovulcanius yangii]|uniref:TATA-box-binding protein n=1 Tax=Methanovulcanius yangii TaxID=1789227 RepID=UPI0029CA38D6|nr:TATA-box-binding protein [Methanovulcanius yangii]